MLPLLQVDHAYVFYGRISEHHPDDALSFLSDEEIRRAENYLLPADRQRSVVSRSVLKQLVARFLEIQEAEVRVDYAGNGKPFLRDYSELQFNVSHSDDAFAIGITPGKEIGIDLENLQRIPAVSALERFLFTDAELQLFQLLDESQRNAVFIRSWTRKEALLKASGDGLTKAMSDLEIAFIEDNRFSLEMTEDQGNKTDWFLEHFNGMDTCLGALAVKGNVKEVHYTALGSSAF